MEDEQSRRKRPGIRKAFPGYYTAKQAQERLGMSRDLFNYYVKTGKIHRYVPPKRKEGQYLQKEIDRMAIEMALFLHLGAEDTTTTPIIETRVATPQDAQGIVDVLHSFGWQTTTAEQRIAWYAVNPLLDYVVTQGDQVVGYVFAAPLKPEALEAMMHGTKRAWHLQPHDFYWYHTMVASYDLYVGVATRQDIPQSRWVSFRLLSGFIDFLIELAEQGIIIRRMYAVSAEPSGQKLCSDLGFVRQDAQEGDRFPRYMLDLETSDSHFAKRYREALR